MQRARLGLHARLTLAALFVLFVLPMARSQEPTITPNYREADVRQIVEAVGEVTGRNFILDPRVNAKSDDALGDANVARCVLRGVSFYFAGAWFCRNHDR